MIETGFSVGTTFMSVLGKTQNINLYIKKEKSHWIKYIQGPMGWNNQWIISL